MLLLAVIWLLSPAMTRPARAQASCLPGCDLRHPTEACCVPCVQDACTTYLDCLPGFDDTFEGCIDAIQPLGGHCALTLDQIHRCRGRRANWKRNCHRHLRSDMRGGCHEDSGLPCRIGSRAARRLCDFCGGVATTTTTTTTTTTLGVAITSQAGDADVDCQARCFRRIARPCFEDCDDRCEHDALALSICQQGCVNNVCRYANAACTDNSRAVADEYRACCNRQGDCEEEVDCEATTTVTRTTTTSTSSSSTTSTTLLLR